MQKPLAIITGASSGIGEVYARKLALDHDLLLIARNKERLEELAQELRRLGAAAAVLQADLSDASQLEMVAARIAAAANLELLVNNAGFGDRAFFWEADIEVLDRMHRLHVTALVRLSHAALRVMVPQNRGAIINLASVAAFARRPGSASYGATKTWVAAFTESLYVDLQAASSSVYVQALCPGYTYSGFHDVMHEDRSRLAPPALWLTAEKVVDDSLRGMKKRQLHVVPGWYYKFAVAMLRASPFWLQIRLARLGAARSRPAARTGPKARTGPEAR
jgi:short-subunit dehydrogenase